MSQRSGKKGPGGGSGAGAKRLLIIRGETGQHGTWIDGEKVRPRSLPRDFGRRSGDWRRYEDTLALLGHVDFLRRKYADEPAPQVWARITRELGPWGRECGLCASKRSIDRYRVRMNPYRLAYDGNVDRRGAAQKAHYSPAAWALFLKLIGSCKMESLAVAWQKVAAEAARQQWCWYASPRGAQSHVKIALARGDVKAEQVRVRSMRRAKR
jgi:hypothetical protein